MVSKQVVEIVNISLYRPDKSPAYIFGCTGTAVASKVSLEGIPSELALKLQ